MPILTQAQHYPQCAFIDRITGRAFGVEEHPTAEAVVRFSDIARTMRDEPWWGEMPARTGPRGVVYAFNATDEQYGFHRADEAHGEINAT